MANLMGLLLCKSILYKILGIILFVTPAYIMQWTKSPAIERFSRQLVGYSLMGCEVNQGGDCGECCSLGLVRPVVCKTSS